MPPRTPPARASDKDSVAGRDSDGLAGRTNIQRDGKNGAITGLKGELPRGLLESLGGYLDFVRARRKRGEIELTCGIGYGGEDFSIGDLAQVNARSRYDGSGLIFYGTGDLCVAVEGAAIMLDLEIDCAGTCAGIPGDCAGGDLDIHGEVVGGVELLIGAGALDEVIAGLATIPWSGLSSQLCAPGVSRC